MYAYSGFSGTDKILLEDGYHLLSELKPNTTYKFIHKNLKYFKGTIIKYPLSNPIKMHTTNNTDIIGTNRMCIMSNKEIIPIESSIGKQIDSIFDPKTGGMIVESIEHLPEPISGYAILLDENYSALENSLSVIINGFIFIMQKNSIEI